MSWRVVVVASNAKVDYKMDYLVVRTLDETRRVHISEIAVLMLESTAVSLTAYAVCELLAHKVKQYTRMEYVVGEHKSEIIDTDERTIYL